MGLYACCQQMEIAVVGSLIGNSMMWNYLPGVLRTLRLAAVLGLAAASGCGGGSSPGSSLSGEQTGPGLVRLAVPARDPAWDWSRSMGAASARGEANDIRLEVSTPPNPFAALAGGHADVAVLNAWDVTELADRTDFDAVIIAKHTTDETFLGVGRASPARDIRDLSGGSIAVDSEFGSTLLWGVIAHDLYGLDLHADSKDFVVTLAESASLADLVVNGDVDACVCRPQFSAQHLQDESLRVLYDGRTGTEVYLDELNIGSEREPMSQALITSREWYSDNSGAAVGLVSLWEAVLGDWALNIENVVVEYPNLFSAQTREQIDWILGYLAENEWFHRSAYLDADDAAAYLELISRMQRIGLVSADASAAEIQFVPRQTAAQ